MKKKIKRGTSGKPLLVIFGTRPEAIKLAPVVHALRTRKTIDLEILSTMQQADLLPAFLDDFSLEPDYRLDSMVAGQSVNQLLARLMEGIASVLTEVGPAAVVVQGDTSTCFAGAMAARMQGIPVIHVEAGLRTGDTENPFPEELNRKLVTQLASLHCAATKVNRLTLLAEGVDDAHIVVTGNPVVDAIAPLVDKKTTPRVSQILQETSPYRLLLLTAHRRENFGAYLDGSFIILREYIETHDDTSLVFPVHPNPAVREAINRCLEGHPRIHLIEPLGYEDFILLCRAALLIVSDSGGIQEEAASLGKPLLVLRAFTERPEAIECGIARLIGPDPSRLRFELELATSTNSWIEEVKRIKNPFGDGSSGRRIADAVLAFLGVDHS